MLYDPTNNQPKTSQLLTDLEAARHLIRTPRLWAKNAFHTHTGRYCIIGAVGLSFIVDAAVRRVAKFNHSDFLVGFGVYDIATQTSLATRARAVIDALHEQLPVKWAVDIHHTAYGKSRRLQSYNDAPIRKHKEVMALFDRAIQAEVVRLRNEELVYAV